MRSKRQSRERAKRRLSNPFLGITASLMAGLFLFDSGSLDNLGLGDQIERAKCPDFRACEAQVVNYRKTPDCVAGDTVMIRTRLQPKFPANREFFREFVKFRPKRVAGIQETAVL
jgi:hypothetical protein